MDLLARFGLKINHHSCTTFVFVSRKCNGLTEWCVEQEVGEGIFRIGCEAFKHCKEFCVFVPEKEQFKHWIQQQVNYFGVPASHGEHSA